MFVYNSSFKSSSTGYTKINILRMSRCVPDGGEVLVLSAFDSGGEWCGEIYGGRAGLGHRIHNDYGGRFDARQSLLQPGRGLCGAVRQPA